MEQEKREQKKQLQGHPMGNQNLEVTSSTNSALLSDHDFEKLTADVSGYIGLGGATSQAVPGIK